MDERPGPSSGTSSYAYLETTCAICLDQLEAPEKSFVDSCRHVFCFQCIRQWSETRAVCPLCKQNFNTILYYVPSEKAYRLHYIESLCRRVLTPSDVHHYLSMHVKRFFSEFVETQDRRPVEVLAKIFGQYYYDSPTYFRVSNESDEGVIPDIPVLMINGYKTVDSDNHDTGSEPGGSASGRDNDASIEKICDQQVRPESTNITSVDSKLTQNSCDPQVRPESTIITSVATSIESVCDPQVRPETTPITSVATSTYSESIESSRDPLVRPETTNITSVATYIDSDEVDSDDDCRIIDVVPLPPGSVSLRTHLMQMSGCPHLGKRKRDHVPTVSNRPNSFTVPNRPSSFTVQNQASSSNDLSNTMGMRSLINQLTQQHLIRFCRSMCMLETKHNCRR